MDIMMEGTGEMAVNYLLGLWREVLKGPINTPFFLCLSNLVNHLHFNRMW
jgi:hypothetical protein